MKNSAPRYCILVDDDQDDRELFLIAAQETNPDLICKCEPDAEQALTLLKNSPEVPDLIFLDINMPRMDGFEFITELKRDETLSTIPVIIYSTTNDKGQMQKAKALGAIGFVTKTSNYQELCSILKGLLS